MEHGLKKCFLDLTGGLEFLDGKEERRGLLRVNTIAAKGRSGTWIWALGLVICLVGCQGQVNKTPPLPPPAPQARPLVRPVRPTFYVAINQLSLRACPSVDCQKISTLELNAEVEKLGETENWTHIKVKKNGTIGYVSSRHLSPHPVEVAMHPRKRHNKARPAKAVQPPEASGKEGEVGPKKEAPSPALPRVM
jgi:hypothetical protein